MISSGLLIILVIAGLAIAVMATLKSQCKSEQRRKAILSPLEEDIERLREQGNFSKALELMDSLLTQLPNDFDLQTRREFLEAEVEGAPCVLRPGGSTLNRKLFEI